MNKITIIGAGSVGSTIAYTLAVNGAATEIVLIDINEDKSYGEAMDIRQGTMFVNPLTIYSGTYRDAVNSNIVILTSGVPRKPGQTRLDLAQTNVDITKKIIPEITKYAPDAKYIIVSNPVDILTYVFHKVSGLPENQIIGSGTILDTARLRSRLAEEYNINQQDVHAYVYGEHGDTSFVPWSLATISNIEINTYHELANKENSLNKEEIEKYIRESGGKIISCKGATFYAVSLSVVHICKTLFCGTSTALTVSSMMNGEYGISDVCLSTLNLVGHNGIKHKIMSPLTDEEITLLRRSADSLKDVIRNLKI